MISEAAVEAAADDGPMRQTFGEPKQPEIIAWAGHEWDAWPIYKKETT